MKTICVFLVALGVFLLAHLLQGASVIPSVLPGNPNCNTLCPGCYSELKVDPPQEGTFSDSVLTVIISNATYKENGEMMSFDWSANIGVNAVIVKAGNQANVYEYDPAVTSDTYLVPPGQQAISHITFCYVPPQLEVEVSGLDDLEITQLRIGDWAATGDFKQSLGNLTVSVTATVAYDIYIYYSYSISSGALLPSLAEPLSFEYQTGSGAWISIPSYPTMAPLPGLSGSATHDYPVRVDLSQLGDRKAGETITFTVHVMATAQ